MIRVIDLCSTISAGTTRLTKASVCCWKLHLRTVSCEAKTCSFICDWMQNESITKMHESARQKTAFLFSQERDEIENNTYCRIQHVVSGCWLHGSRGKLSSFEVIFSRAFTSGSFQRITKASWKTRGVRWICSRWRASSGRRLPWSRWHSPLVQDLKMAVDFRLTLSSDCGCPWDAVWRRFHHQSCWEGERG